MDYYENNDPLKKLSSLVEVYKVWLQGKSSLLPAFEIKFYWNTASPIPLHIVFGLSCPTRVEFSRCDADHMAHKAENICYPVLAEKVFLTFLSRNVLFSSK